jgi:hypothetical protein
MNRQDDETRVDIPEVLADEALIQRRRKASRSIAIHHSGRRRRIRLQLQEPAGSVVRVGGLAP